jgi:hypothetical protein
LIKKSKKGVKKGKSVPEELQVELVELEGQLAVTS